MKRIGEALWSFVSRFARTVEMPGFSREDFRHYCYGSFGGAGPLATGSAEARDYRDADPQGTLRYIRAVTTAEGDLVAVRYEWNYPGEINDLTGAMAIVGFGVNPKVDGHTLVLESDYRITTPQGLVDVLNDITGAEMTEIPATGEQLYQQVLGTSGKDVQTYTLRPFRLPLNELMWRARWRGPLDGSLEIAGNALTDTATYKFLFYTQPINVEG